MKFIKIENIYDSVLQDESGSWGKAQWKCAPTNAAEIQEALAYARDKGLTVTVQGARTNLSGSALPAGGLVIELDKLGDAPRWDTKREDCLIVTAGTTLETVQSYLRIQNSRLLVEPTEATATLGGMFSQNARGLWGGNTGEMVESLIWLTSEGEIWELKRSDYEFSAGACQLPKGDRVCFPTLAPVERQIKPWLPVEGQDLISFLAGKEGSLGIAVELGLKTERLPDHHWCVMFFLTDVDQGQALAENWACKEFASALKTLNFYNRETLDLFRRHASDLATLKEFPEIPPEVACAFYLEVAGDDEEAVEMALEGMIEDFTEAGGEEEMTWAGDDLVEVNRLRAFPHGLTELINLENNRLLNTGVRKMRRSLDYVLQPQDALALGRDFGEKCQAENMAAIFYCDLLSGRGHGYCLPEDQEREEVYGEIVADFEERITTAGGQPFDEYGVGRVKGEAFKSFLGSERLAAWSKLRAVFDPGGLLGQGGE